MKEIWKEIEGFNGQYLVSNLGRVKSLERVVTGINISEFNRTRKKTIKQENGIQRKDTQTLYGLLPGITITDYPMGNSLSCSKLTV